jgi:hypothetical protein
MWVLICMWHNEWEAFQSNIHYSSQWYWPQHAPGQMQILHTETEARNAKQIQSFLYNDAFRYIYVIRYTECPKGLEPMGILFIIYCLHYMFTPTVYAFSQPFYHVCSDFAQHIGIESSTTVCNSLPMVMKISDFNSLHLCLQESPITISTISSNVNAIFILLTFNFNL